MTTRKLDSQSEILIKQNNEKINKKPLEIMYFDVAIGFRADQLMEYRMLVFRFKERKLYFVRHGKVREEYLFTSLSTVQPLESNKLRLTLCETLALSILPQNPSDLNALFRILRSITTNVLRELYYEDFCQDRVVLKLEIDCRKRGRTFWARRHMHIYNGLFVLYENERSECPLTILTLSDNVAINIHPKSILEIVCLIRKVLLKFDNDSDRDVVVQALSSCRQYHHPPLQFPVKDFFSGKLTDLTPTCRDYCIKNYLYPEECQEHFDVLCEILRAATKKRYATMTEKRAMMIKKDEPHEQKQQPQPIPSEDDLMRYCINEDPLIHFSNLVSIGKGGFGEVFCAQKKDGGGFVALKVLKHSAEERYAKIGAEVARLYQWKHPNIVAFSGCWISNHKVFIGMEYCSMGNLKSILKNKMGNFADQDIAYILTETLKGLAYIHEQGFVHRDIKTANILMKSSYEIKLIDFGLVVRINSNPQNRAGSKSYMAPEVIKQVPYNQKVDIWSLGCVAQELFEGQPPYREHGVIRGLFRTATVGAQGLRNVSKANPDFVDFCSRCFKYNPEERPECVELLEHQFLRLAEGSQMRLRSLKK